MMTQLQMCEGSLHLTDTIQRLQNVNMLNILSHVQRCAADHNVGSQITCRLLCITPQSCCLSGFHPQKTEEKPPTAAARTPIQSHSILINTHSLNNRKVKWPISFIAKNATVGPSGASGTLPNAGALLGGSAPVSH